MVFAVAGEKWLLMTEMLDERELAAPTATLSSPSEIQELVMVVLVVFRGRCRRCCGRCRGSRSSLPQAVKPVTVLRATWKLGEFLKVIL